MSDPSDALERGEALTERHLRVVRTGHGANCSSIGSVIDTLFATATVGAAVFAAVMGALRKEEIRIVSASPAGAKDLQGQAKPPEADRP